MSKAIEENKKKVTVKILALEHNYIGNLCVQIKIMTRTKHTKLTHSLLPLQLQFS